MFIPRFVGFTSPIATHGTAPQVMPKAKRDFASRMQATPVGAVALLLSIVLAVAEMNWAIRGLFVLVAASLITHLSWRLLRGRVRWMAAITAVAILLTLTWRPIWEDFQKNHPEPLPPSASALSLPFGFSGTPLAWSQPYLACIEWLGCDSEKIVSISFQGINVSKEVIQLKSAYLESGMSGEKMNLLASVGTEKVPLTNINPVPPDAMIELEGTLGATEGLSKDEFLEDWGIITFVVEYEGDRQKINFDQNAVSALVSALAEHEKPGPHVSKRKDKK